MYGSRTMKAPFLEKFYLLVLPLVVFLINVGVALASGQCQGDQKSLMLNLKGSLSFNHSKSSSELASWGSGRDCCRWEGVSCDSGGLGHVIGLDLSNKSISGWDPSAVFTLRYLQNLSLAFNSFNTTIPAGLANLTELVYLNLSNAGFIGQVPDQLSQMTKLVTLDLSFSGLYSKGSSLKLEEPNLPSLVRNLARLRELCVDGISLSGGGNNWWQALSSSLLDLQVLSLSNCNISGPVDASLVKMKLLSTIKLNSNNLSGQVPHTILQGPALETIDLSSNKNLVVTFPAFHQNQSLKNLLLSDTRILGNLPQSIGYLKNLSRVELARCNLTGAIPSSMANLTQLISLDLSFNMLSGPVPSFQMSGNLTYLDLSKNQLSGKIPSRYLQGVHNLGKLDFSYNLFSGSIPPSLFAIPSLQQIQLCSNQFGGHIPEFQYASISLLNILDLSSNNLSGPIPSSVFDLSRLNILSLSSNKLNGSIHLDQVRKLVNLTSIDLSHNNLSVEAANNHSNLSSFPQFTTLKLASCHLTMFPDLGNQSKLYYLDLSNNNIPEVHPWLEKFTTESLAVLNLSRNLLTSIPEPSKFHNLYLLDVHGNQLCGDIPLPPLGASYVDYSANNFSSSLPKELGQSMTFTVFFSLKSNSLSGGIPESICHASYLQVLDLSNNNLTGEIPTCLIGGNTNLGVLNLRKNSLSGTIPDNFQVKCGLQTLDLSSNVLHGEVPRTLANCTMLEVLDLGSNQIYDTFPCFLKDNLSNLRVLILRNNQFHGKIGCNNLTSWKMLQIADLAQNQFNGVLSEDALLTWKAMMEGGHGAHDHIKFEALMLSNLYYQDSVTVTSKGVQLELVKILTYFTSIDFSCNQLEGPLPGAIGDFQALYLLNLSHNSFDGPILPNIGNLSQLESLDLSVNHFSGAIPQQLSTLTFLSFLNVSDNKLTGAIPISTQIQSFQASSFEGNAGLCGPPLSQSCHSSATPAVSPIAAHKKSGMNWQFILPGVGFGMGAAAVVAPLLFDKDMSNWCDGHVDSILLVLLPMFGFVYYAREDWRIEHDKEHPRSDDDEEEDDDTFESDFTGEGAYCLFCTKLDTAMKRVVHDPKCTCHLSPPTSCSSSYSSSASLGTF